MRDTVQSLSHSKWNCKYHIPFSGEFSTPESEFITENGGNSRQRGRGLSVFAGFSQFSPFYRRRASIPLRPFAARTGAALPA